MRVAFRHKLQTHTLPLRMCRRTVHVLSTLTSRRLLENGSVKTDLCKDNKGDGDFQSLWPASSENVPVNLSLLHCGHCLWDWTFPHGSRKQQTDVCRRQHLSKQFWVRSYSVFTAPPGAHICWKCAYVFTHTVSYSGSFSTVNETCNKTKDTVKKMSVHIWQVPPAL